MPVKYSSFNLMSPKLESQLNNGQKKGIFYWVGLIALIVLTLIVIGGIIAIVTLYVMGRRFTEYAIVIDAGSSASKVLLYSWPTFLSLTNAPVTQSSELCRTKHGISFYETNIQDSASEIIECLKKKPFTDIPKEQISYVNLYLGATAGMRMLNYSNLDATNKIYDHLRKQLPLLGYAVSEPANRIRTISGEEEAITAWITVNYLKEKFGKQVNGVFQPGQSKPEDTFGSLDLGGASTQVTFIPASEDIAKIDRSLMTEKVLFGQTYNVFGFSHLCYGKGQVEIRQLAMLVTTKPNQLFHDNPCMAPGSNVTLSSPEIFMAPCVNGKFAEDAFNKSIDPPTKETVNYTFIGTGNHDECTKDYVEPLFNVPIIKRAKIPPIRGKFQAFAAFYTVLHHMQLAPTTTLDTYNTAIINLCRKPIDNKDPYEPYYCFDAIYIRHLLQSYGFNETSWRDIEFTSKIANSDVSWSLGFMIDQSGHLIKNMPSFPNSIISFNLFIGLLIFLIILLLIFAGVFLFTCVLRKR